MNMARNEQINDPKINFDALMAMSKIALSSIERIAALNLHTARTVLQDGITSASTAASTKDVKELQHIGNPMLGHAAQSTAAYLHSALGIAAETQAQATKVMVAYFSQINDGANSRGGLINGVEILKQVSSQFSAMANAGTKAVADAVTQTAASVASHSKKTS